MTDATGATRAVQRGDPSSCSTRNAEVQQRRQLLRKPITCTVAGHYTMSVLSGSVPMTPDVDIDVIANDVDVPSSFFVTPLRVPLGRCSQQAALAMRDSNGNAIVGGLSALESFAVAPLEVAAEWAPHGWGGQRGPSDPIVLPSIAEEMEAAGNAKARATFGTSLPQVLQSDAAYIQIMAARGYAAASLLASETGTSTDWPAAANDSLATWEPHSHVRVPVCTIGSNFVAGAAYRLQG